MSWTAPKTDWVNTDYFNVSDYSRIKNNLIELRNMSALLFSVPEYTNMPDKTYTSMLYASEFNIIENNLVILNSNTYNLDMGTKPIYSSNQHTPDFNEYNRIENAISEIHKHLSSDLEAMPELAYTAGQMREVKE